MSHYLFSYAAKSLQTYIMRGGKLRDMVGATSLIDKLSDEATLRDWLTGPAFGLAKGTDFEIVQAAAGGGRIRLLNEEAARNVSRRWPLWCHAWAPDLEVVQRLEPWEGKSYGQVSEAVGRALEQARNFPAPRLPEAGPFAKRAPRTGEPAVGVDHEAEKEPIDLASRRKRTERKHLKDSLPPVATAFGFTHPDELPNDFEQVSGREGAYLAVIHADGNLLGQMFLRVGRAMADDASAGLDDETAIRLFRHLSQIVVADGTREAARRAMDSVRERIDRTVAANRGKAEKNPRAWEQRSPEAWPFAPIVLAGDDLTVACRADLGLPFTKAFLATFRDEMKRRLATLREESWWGALPSSVKDAIPEELSAGAGIVFCTDHYPFSLAYELCESLASHAKGAAKERVGAGQAPPSALSFVRISGGSAPTDFAGLSEGILKGDDGILLTGAPWFIDGEQHPRLEDLEAVYEAVLPPASDTEEERRGLPGSTLRQILNLQRTDATRVPEAVERMLEVADKGAAEGFEKAWRKLSGHQGGEPDWKNLRFFDAGKSQASALLDVLTLLAVRRPEDDASHDPNNSES